MDKPITKKDIRFVEFWKEQREGSVLKYYALYTISWGLLTIFLSFFVLMFLGGISIIPIAQDNYKVAVIIMVGFMVGFITALISRSLNEKHYWKILTKVRNQSKNLN